MNPDVLIKAYVDDIASHLPRKQRNDVALELQALLAEELRAKADAAGRAPDQEMTLALLNAFGTPDDVAARYLTPSGVVIIDPVDTRAFVISVLVGMVLLWVLGLVPLLQRDSPDPLAWLMVLQHWWLGPGLIAPFWWTGLMTLVFAMRSARRRAKARHVEAPGLSGPKALDRDRASRWSAALGIPAALIGIALFLWPASFFTAVMPEGFDTSWTLYTDEFRSARLPFILVLWGASLTLFAVVAFFSRWRPLTRRIEIGINFAWAALLLWCALGGPIYQARPADDFIRALMGAIGVGALFVAVFHLRREMSRPARGGVRKPPGS